MDTCFMLIKVSLITLATIVLIHDLIYILLNGNYESISSNEIPHVIGIIVGLFIRVLGLVAAIREQQLLAVVYAISMAIITALTPINLQFVINLFTIIVAFVYAAAIKLRYYSRAQLNANMSSSPVHVVRHNHRHQFHAEQPSAPAFTRISQSHSDHQWQSVGQSYPAFDPPLDPPPYYAPPPPPYSESVK